MSTSVVSRIAAKLNAAIQTAVDPAQRFKTKFEKHYSFFQLAKLLSLPAALAFALNAVPFLRGSDDNFFYGWRLLAHVGPYHLPRLVEKEEWKSSLERLGKANELQLIESEIAQLLSNIEVVTQRRIAVKKIVKKYGFSVFTPIFENLAAPPPVNTWRKSQSHFEANLRIAMDLVSATPARERHITNFTVIENLLTNNKDVWESDINTDSKRFREYRALILLKLLQNEQNLELAKKSQIVISFLNSELPLSKHQPFPSLPLIPFLHQFKTEKLGFEFLDVIKRIRILMELPVSDEDRKTARKSLTLQHKLDFSNFEKLVYLTICYASLRVVPLISEYSFKVLSRASHVIARSVIGAALLETFYRAEEHLIQSSPWYESSGLFASSAMVSTNILIGILVLKYFPFCGIPWAMIRVKDSFSDTFRFI